MCNGRNVSHLLFVSPLFAVQHFTPPHHTLHSNRSSHVILTVSFPLQSSHSLPCTNTFDSRITLYYKYYNVMYFVLLNIYIFIFNLIEREGE